MVIIKISDVNFDEYPNEVSTLPTNLQQLVSEAMQTITLETSTSTSTKMDLNVPL